MNGNRFAIAAARMAPLMPNLMLLRMPLLMLLLLLPSCQCLVTCLFSSSPHVDSVSIWKKYPPAHDNHVIKVYRDAELPKYSGTLDGVRMALIAEAPAHEEIGSVEIGEGFMTSGVLTAEYAKRVSRHAGGDAIRYMGNVPGPGWFSSRKHFRLLRFTKP